METSTAGNLRLYATDTVSGVADTPLPATIPFVPPAAIDAHELANRELIRPHTYRSAPRGPEAFSAAWFEEIEQRRYARHGSWLPSALEFGRHPGESVLLLHPGLGTDAVQYVKNGTNVTLAIAPHDHAELIRTNLERRALHARFASWDEHDLPFADGEFDIVAWNGLHHCSVDPQQLVTQLYRILKPGGKVIGLFPAKYDTGYWQDLALPLQRLYWHRPPDPTTSPKTCARHLRRLFGRFEEHRVSKRHLRRSELPHLWRLWPLTLLERVLGRVLVLKAFKPLTAIRTSTTFGTTSLAA
jgi:SAM-dependent methyltransferase